MFYILTTNTRHRETTAKIISSIKNNDNYNKKLKEKKKLYTPSVIPKYSMAYQSVT